MGFQMPRVASQGAVGVGVPQVRGIGQGQEVNTQTMAAIQQFSQQIKQRRLEDQQRQQRTAMAGELNGEVNPNLPMGALMEKLKMQDALKVRDEGRIYEKGLLDESRTHAAGLHQRDLAEVIQGKASNRLQGQEDLALENTRTDRLKTEENERLRGVAEHKLGGQIALEGMRQQGLSSRSKDKGKGGGANSIKNKMGYSKQFEAELGVKRYRDTSKRLDQSIRVYRIATGKGKHNASDQALIVNFNKMFDDSTVRVSEFDRYGIGQGFWNMVQGLLPKTVEGGVGLDQGERDQIINVMKTVVAGHKLGFDETKKHYEGLITSGQGNPEGVFRGATDYKADRVEQAGNRFMEAAASSGKPISIQEAARMAVDEEERFSKRIR